MILIIGIVTFAVMLALSVGFAVCASVVARRSDDALEPHRLADEPALMTRRFARDPSGRPIAAPRPQPRRRPSVARG